MTLMRLIGILALGMAFAACSGGGNSVSSQVDAPPVDVVRLEKIVYERMPADSSVEDALVALGRIMGFDTTSASLEEYAASPAVQVFTPDVISAYPDLGGLASALGGIETGIKTVLPAISAHRYYTIVSPYSQSVYIYADSIVFIALNHYMGEDYEGYRGRFADYEKRLKTPSRIPLDVAQALIASAFPYEAPRDGATLASHMLYEGAVALVCAEVAGVSDAEILGYSPAQWRWLDENKSELWKALLGRNLLYSTSPADAARLISPAPSTSSLHPQAPGRAGRYLGLEIVRAYLASHPDTDLSRLLSLAFYADDRTVAESGFTGR